MSDCRSTPIATACSYLAATCWTNRNYRRRLPRLSLNQQQRVKGNTSPIMVMRHICRWKKLNKTTCWPTKCSSDVEARAKSAKVFVMNMYHFFKVQIFLPLHRYVYSYLSLRLTMLPAEHINSGTFRRHKRSNWKFTYFTWETEKTTCERTNEWMNEKSCRLLTAVDGEKWAAAAAEIIPKILILNNMHDVCVCPALTVSEPNDVYGVNLCR